MQSLLNYESKFLSVTVLKDGDCFFLKQDGFLYDIKKATLEKLLACFNQANGFDFSRYFESPFSRYVFNPLACIMFLFWFWQRS